MVAEHGAILRDAAQSAAPQDDGDVLYIVRYFPIAVTSGSTPSPGLSASTIWPSLISATAPQKSSRSGLPLLSTSSNPPPPDAASRCAEANSPMPPPRKCGQ